MTKKYFLNDITDSSLKISLENELILLIFDYVEATAQFQIKLTKI